MDRIRYYISFYGFVHNPGQGNMAEFIYPFQASRVKTKGLILSYYNWSLHGICLFRIYSAVYGPRGPTIL